MAKKKSDPQEVNLSLREATRLKIFQEKKNELVNYLQSQSAHINNPLSRKLALLSYVYDQYRVVHDSFHLTHDGKYKGKYKTILGFLQNNNVPIPEKASSFKHQSVELFRKLPNDLLLPVFSDLLSPKSTAVNDPTDILLLLKIFLFYYLHLESQVSPRISAMMDAAFMELTWEAFKHIRKMDDSGWNNDRTSESTSKKKANVAAKVKDVETCYIHWLNVNQDSRSLLQQHFTKTKMATIIHEETKKILSVRKIISILEAYHTRVGSPPPWAPPKESL
jgi:hypothetical protein